MRGRLLLCMCLLFSVMGAVSPARAAERRGLLLLGASEKSLDLTYQFSGSQQQTSSMEHDFYEDLNYKVRFAVLRPSLLKGELKTTLRFEQKDYERSSESTQSGFENKLRFLYNLHGTLFDRSRAPGDFSVANFITDVSSPYGASYQSFGTSYDLRWSLANRYVPVSIRYNASDSETSGKSQNSKTSTEEVYFTATHTREVSQSELDLLMNRNKYSLAGNPDSSERRYEARFLNTVNLNDPLLPQFSTRLNFSETAGINYARESDFSEEILWTMGKALRSGALYLYTVMGGDQVSRQRQTGSLWLQHQLFESLTTRLDGSIKDESSSEGSIRDTMGGISLTYHKVLPLDGRLDVTAGQTYGMENRMLNSSQGHSENEDRFTLDHLRIDTPLRLSHTNVVRASIVVRNADLPIIYPSSEYDVNVYGAVSEIVPRVGGAIDDAAVKSLVINYDYQADPSADIRTIGTAFAGSITLLNNAYRFYANYSQIDRQTVSRQPSLSGDSSQLYTLFGFERAWSALTATTEYEISRNESDRHQAAMIRLRYFNELKGGLLTVYLNNRYQWNDPAVSGGVIVQRPDENSAAATVSYRRALFSRVSLTVSGDYLNTSGSLQSDRFRARSTLLWPLGKLTMQLNTSFGFYRTPTSNQTDESVNLSISRYF